MFTTRVIPSRTAYSRGLTSLCLLISLVMVACAAVPQTPERVLAPASTPKATSSVHPPDAAASYHFMLGYQAELAQDMDRAIRNIRPR